MATTKKENMFTVFAALKGEDFMTIREISDKTGWQRNTVTQYCRHLERQGLLECVKGKGRTLLWKIKGDYYPPCNSHQNQSHGALNTPC